MIAALAGLCLNGYVVKMVHFHVVFVDLGKGANST